MKNRPRLRRFLPLLLAITPFSSLAGTAEIMKAIQESDFRFSRSVSEVPFMPVAWAQNRFYPKSTFDTFMKRFGVSEPPPAGASNNTSGNSQAGATATFASFHNQITPEVERRRYDKPSHRWPMCAWLQVSERMNGVVGN